MPIQFDQSTAGVVTLQAPASGSYTLQFPSGNGSNNQYLVSDGTGGLSWDNLTGLSNITPALNTASPNNTVNVSSLSAIGGTTNLFFALTTSTNGGIVQAAIADSTATGGNARGTAAFDFQMARSAATQVASGTSSSIIGGYGNTVSGNYSTIAGGKNNTLSGSICFIGGGELNSITSSSTSVTILGGYSNSMTSSSAYSIILGGRANTSDGTYQAILGGYGGSGNGVMCTTIFPTANPLGLSTTNALLGAGVTSYYYSDSNAAFGYATIDKSAQTAKNQIALRTNSVYLVIAYAGLYEAYYPLHTGKYGYSLFRRGATAASTTVVSGGSDMTIIYKNNAFNNTLHVNAAADTTNGAVAMSCYSDQINHYMSDSIGLEYLYIQY